MRGSSLRRHGFWLLVLGGLGVACGNGDEGSDNAISVDVRADTNRDGIVDLEDPTDDLDEETWDADHGAIFLPNLDDDELRCPSDSSVSDLELASCHDAADEVVNGPDDLRDLARLRIAPWPGAPDSASGTLALSASTAERVRLFQRFGDEYRPFAPGDRFDAADLRSGVELALEGRDVVRDPSAWDGVTDVTLLVRDHPDGAEFSDTVRLRQAPIVIAHHRLPPHQVMVTRFPGIAGSVEFRADLADAVDAAGVEYGLVELPDYGGDQWTQDHFETGWVSMPAPQRTHSILVFLRAPNVWHADDADSPLRDAGRVVFEQFRGVDIGGVQQFDIETPEPQETLSSLGNLEAIPPYEHDGESYPHGRMLIGSTDSLPMDARFAALLEAQRVQPLVRVDTSWLHVGHVDEVLTFVPADSPRGWVLLLNDPALARAMLEDASAQGHGQALLFEGQSWADDVRLGSAEVTIDEVLADPDVMAASAEAAVEIDAMFDVLREATGLTDAEVVRVPYLHTGVFGKLTALQPATLNGIVLSLDDFAAPRPHGPVIDGQDPFEIQLVEALGTRGVTVHFIEDWNAYHRFNGEVHCGTNALRPAPATPWWEGGR